jgi:hypothetical protein
MANRPAESSKKPRGKAFAKGKSGNPGGRPKLPEDIKHVRELARKYTASAVAALVEVLDGDSAAARVAAANAILDRGWGKPEQAIVGAGENGEHLFSEIVRRIVSPK